ncbi:transcriptional regulator [Enterococcus hulanensis]|uniref:transcriptional regulator n=1 Tax=Enterococcus hulanensis TaxID=2559929 RepID=UPI00288CCFCA|nr:transcriptional regulator [Enterococcus hulanensis]MDT2660680.1 transcriptional regulator [Enterococcus hulanensis]
MLYSVYRFIEEDLDMTPNGFAKSVEMPQSSLSNWKQREKSVNTLPIQILVDLAAESGLTYEEVIQKLMKYEIDYDETQKAGIELNG